VYYKPKLTKTKERESIMLPVIPEQTEWLKILWIAVTIVLAILLIGDILTSNRKVKKARELFDNTSDELVPTEVSLKQYWKGRGVEATTNRNIAIISIGYMVFTYIAFVDEIYIALLSLF
jgi:phosphoglycerol transferase MdoB-like AlkP superfamily enzyme